MAIEDTIPSTVNLVRVLTRMLIKKGSVVKAREFIQDLRIACDELTGEINDRRRADVTQ